MLLYGGVEEGWITGKTLPDHWWLKADRIVESEMAKLKKS
ncbi:hypothetical protein ADIS_0815 [Lunatimonas lonarensis]|uniref:Uncharacterized protein n=1 Tax=Lunatimonas lonarensis TaxID=1232681 RepID=R7ZWX6_9BACT|nr:hypothetical protein ADIS_0815 [Lunatimonas lonarensis]